MMGEEGKGGEEDERSRRYWKSLFFVFLVGPLPPLLPPALQVFEEFWAESFALYWNKIAMLGA